MSKNWPSLYECMNARYPMREGYWITCRAGHKLGSGYVNPLMAFRGQPLVFKACRYCPDVDYEKMDYPDEVGWIKRG